MFAFANMPHINSEATKSRSDASPDLVAVQRVQRGVATVGDFQDVFRAVCDFSERCQDAVLVQEVIEAVVVFDAVGDNADRCGIGQRW